MIEEAPLTIGAKLRLAREILAAYLVARWTLRRRGLRDALRVLRSARGTGALDGPSVDRVAAGRRLGRATTRTLAALPTDSRCLMQSLALTRVLARRGIESELVIAVQPGERFAAHAWIEAEGTALLPPGVFAFERLVTL